MVSRREILQGGLLMAAVAGCERLTKSASSADLGTALQNKIFLKGDAGYEAVRQAGIWNGRKPERFPAAIVLAENESDVIHAVSLARDKGWKVGTRSGGHSWEATHTREGALLINLAKMKQIKVSPEERLAVVSPSTKGEELNNILREEHSLMFPSAHGYGVGIGGFVMHGGHGWNYGSFGYGCENLAAIDVVTPRGELIHANEKTNSDYLWAARGSGPGFFGVVVRMYLRVHPYPKLQRFTTYSFLEPEFEAVLRWMESVNDAVPPFLELLALGHLQGGAPQLTLRATIHGENDKQIRAVRDLLATCPVILRAVQSAKEQPAVFPAPKETEGFFPTGGRFVCDGSWSNAEASALIPPFVKAIKTIPTDKSFVFWKVSGPGRKLPDMAYSLNARNYLSPTTVSIDAKDDKRCEDWTQAFIRDLLPISIGGQFNDDNSIMNQRYGLRRSYLSKAAAERMKRLLARYDPENMFGYLAPY